MLFKHITVFSELSPESVAGSSETGSYRSPLCSPSRRGAAQIVGGVLELVAYYRAAGDGQAFSTRGSVTGF